MERRENAFTLIGQGEIVPDIALGVCDGLAEAYRNCFGIPKQVAMALRGISITGCGDSWMTSNAVLPAFRELAGLEAEAQKAIDFSRFSCLADRRDTLVAGVTISGGVVRTRECILRAAKYGMPTLAVTNSPKSATADVSDYVAVIGMPPGLVAGYGLHSYCCSAVVLLHVAVALAVARERFTPEQGEREIAALRSYIESYRPYLPRYDALAEELAGRWKGLRAFEFIADGNDYSTAYFSCANVFEEFGGEALGMSSARFGYANRYAADPASIGRVFVVNEASETKEQLLACIEEAVRLGSPVAVLTDTERLKLPREAAVFLSPKAAHPWLHAAFQHLGFDFVVGQIRKSLGVVSFCAEMDCFASDAVRGRLKNSQLIAE